MVSVAPDGAVQIDITGDTTGFVTGNPPNDATGDLDATVNVSPNWTPLFNTWEISADPGIGTASINASTGEWVYVIDPVEFAALDNGELAADVFEVTITAYVLNPGGQLRTETETQLITIAIEGVCFALGTLIDTAVGPVPVEKLKVGDLVVTADHALQPIRWIEGDRVSSARLGDNPGLQPVRIAAGALGPGVPKRDLCVSQQHRIVVSGPVVQLLFGEAEALVAAKSLCSWPGIDISLTAGPVVYFHILLDRHEILSAEGTPAESLYLGDEALCAMSSEGLQELAEIFREKLGNMPDGFGSTARRVLRDYEAAVLGS